MREGAAFFLDCLNANAPKVAVENPVMHGYAREIVGRGPDFSVQPWQFGDPFKKRTCFWTRGLPPLMPDIKQPPSVPDGEDAASFHRAMSAVHLASPGADRWKFRSTTYPGIAKAIALQWGGAA